MAAQDGVVDMDIGEVCHERIPGGFFLRSQQYTHEVYLFEESLKKLNEILKTFNDNLMGVGAFGFHDTHNLELCLNLVEHIPDDAYILLIPLNNNVEAEFLLQSLTLPKDPAEEVMVFEIDVMVFKQIVTTLITIMSFVLSVQSNTLFGEYELNKACSNGPSTFYVQTNLLKIVELYFNDVNSLVNIDLSLNPAFKEIAKKRIKKYIKYGRRTDLMLIKSAFINHLSVSYGIHRVLNREAKTLLKFILGLY